MNEDMFMQLLEMASAAGDGTFVLLLVYILVPILDSIIVASFLTAVAVIIYKVYKNETKEE